MGLYGIYELFFSRGALDWTLYICFDQFLLFFFFFVYFLFLLFILCISVFIFISSKYLNIFSPLPHYSCLMTTFIFRFLHLIEYNLHFSKTIFVSLFQHSSYFTILFCLIFVFKIVSTEYQMTNHIFRLFVFSAVKLFFVLVLSLSVSLVFLHLLFSFFCFDFLSFPIHNNIHDFIFFFSFSQEEEVVIHFLSDCVGIILHTSTHKRISNLIQILFACKHAS